MAPTQRRVTKPDSEKDKGPEDDTPTSLPATVGITGSFPALKSQTSVLLLGLLLGALYGWYQWSRGSAPIEAVPKVTYDTKPTKDGGPFTVVDIPGKGKGAIATRNIRQGELIIQEKPLFVVPPTISEPPTQFVWSKLENITEEERKSFFDLSYANFPADKDPKKDLGTLALATFETNAVAAGENVGVFPRMARFNHGCSSAFNVVYTWRDKEQALTVFAIKDIKKGEELLTTYTDTKKTREQRREYLKKHYGFDCSCSVCSLPEKESKASDARLSGMFAHHAELGKWGLKEITGTQAIELIRKIWKLGDEEGYYSERGRLAADAVWVAAAHSDLDAMQAWAKLAIEWYTIELGADSELATEMRNIVQWPHLHNVWGTREKLVVGGPEEARKASL